MYRVPSRRKKSHDVKKPNLIPILDAVFIFIFFLLMSTSFVKIFEISSDIPLISNRKPPKNKKPLALTLKITQDSLFLYRNVPSILYRRFGKLPSGDFDLVSLHEVLLQLKKRYTKEKDIILDPAIDIKYDQLIKIMDTVRKIQPTDNIDLTEYDKDNIEIKVEDLFNNIIFGNIQS